MHATCPVINIVDVKISIAGQWIHQGVNLRVEPGEIIAIVGGSALENRPCYVRFYP